MSRSHFIATRWCSYSIRNALAYSLMQPQTMLHGWINPYKKYCSFFLHVEKFRFLDTKNCIIVVLLKYIWRTIELRLH